MGCALAESIPADQRWRRSLCHLDRVGIASLPFAVRSPPMSSHHCLDSRGVHRLVKSMIDDMVIFRTTVWVAHPAGPDDRRELANVMVDTGSEYNWLPRRVLEELGVQQQRVDRFRTADGAAATAATCTTSWERRAEPRTFVPVPTSFVLTDLRLEPISLFGADGGRYFGPGHSVPPREGASRADRQPIRLRRRNIIEGAGR